MKQAISALPGVSLGWQRQQQGLSCRVEHCGALAELSGVTGGLFWRWHKDPPATAAGAQGPSLLPSWCFHWTFSSSHQLNLISDLRSFRQRPIFRDWSAAAMTFRTWQEWKTIVSHLPQISWAGLRCKWDTALPGPGTQAWSFLSSGLEIKPLYSRRKKIPTLPQLLHRGDGNILHFKPVPPLCTEKLFCSISEVSNPLFMACSSFKARAGSDLK